MSGRGVSSQDYKCALGRYIRQLRNSAGLTQAELAEKLCITYYTSISAIETGRNVVPPERYLEFAQALGVLPKDFGRRVLELTNPWMSVMLFEENPTGAMAELNCALSERLGKEPQDPRFRKSS